MSDSALLSKLQPSKSVSFVELQNRMQEFWSRHNAVYLLPYSGFVGAGTYHPATVFGALGDSHTSVCYIQPSCRPQDGRYGDSFNRMYQHHQFQVFLKPAPKDAQKLLYDCLDFIGIDTSVHDIRFIENNWESPVLGANGVGWEIWCDGTEVCQYTYFQKIGNKNLTVMPIEYAFGMERLLTILNHSQHIMDIPWSHSVKYRDVRYQEENEYSEYVFKHIKQKDKDMSESFAEVNRLLGLQLVCAAYDVFLTMVHRFNLLHGFGALGVAERAQLVLELRKIANRCCDVYLERYGTKSNGA